MSPEDTLIYWIKERYSILTLKRAGAAKPWTDDPILQTYRFCNVHREDDIVTQWIHNEWLKEEDPHCWFAMVVARLINWPDSLAELGYPAPWRRDYFLKKLQARKARGEKVFSGAYIVSTNGHALDKLEYLADYVLTPLWNDRKMLRPTPADTLASFHGRLMQFDGLGSFMAAQVVADAKHVFPLAGAADRLTFAAPGPGSLRGMNRLLGLHPDATFKKGEWLQLLVALCDKLARHKSLKHIPPIDAQNVQNCLCEFDKYMRTRNNEGRPRSTYPGRN